MRATAAEQALRSQAEAKARKEAEAKEQPLVSMILRGGFSKVVAARAGYSEAQLQAALKLAKAKGFVMGLKEAGFSMTEVKKAGYTWQEAHKAGYPASLNGKNRSVPSHAWRAGIEPQTVKPPAPKGRVTFVAPHVAPVQQHVARVTGPITAQELAGCWCFVGTCAEIWPICGCVSIDARRNNMVASSGGCAFQLCLFPIPYDNSEFGEWRPEHHNGGNTVRGECCAIVSWPNHIPQRGYHGLECKLC